MGNSKSTLSHELEEYVKKIDKFDFSVCLLSEDGKFVIMNEKCRSMFGAGAFEDKDPDEIYPYGSDSEAICEDIFVQPFSSALKTTFTDPMGRTQFYWCHRTEDVSSDIMISIVYLMALRHNGEVYAQAAIEDLIKKSKEETISKETLMKLKLASTASVDIDSK